MAEGDFALEDPRELLVALKEVDPTDQVAVEAFRRHVCAGCAASVGEDEETRLALCQTLRCGLRDDIEFHAEQQWLLTALYFLDNEQRPDLHPGKVRELNRRIWNSGAVVLRLALKENGKYTVAVEARSLLARLHGAVVTFLARGSGDRLLDFRAITLHELQDMQREERQHERKERANLVVALYKRRVDEHGQHGAETWVHEQTGVDRKDIRKILERNGLKKPRNYQRD